MSSSSEDTKVRSPDDVATRTAAIAAVKPPAKWFVLGGIIAGTLDLAYALTFSALRGVRLNFKSSLTPFLLRDADQSDAGPVSGALPWCA
jgi:hypothetical protein